MQANMFSIVMRGSDETERSVIVKRIVPQELPEKPSLEIWQGFISSVRTEIDFYRDLLQPENAGIRSLFPNIYISSGTDHALDNTPIKTSFSIIMQDLSRDYVQKPGMNKREAMLVMESLARLHAHYWNRVQSTDRSVILDSDWLIQHYTHF